MATTTIKKETEWVKKTGDTMTGSLTLNNADRSHRAIYFNANGTETGWISTDNQTNVMQFLQHTPNDANAFALYQFPAPDETEPMFYEILTNKRPVLVANGGTGATSAAGARTNIGDGCPSTTFTTADGKTVTVTNGFITNVTG